MVCLLSASGCPIANRNKLRSLEGGGGGGLGVGVGLAPPPVGHHSSLLTAAAAVAPYGSTTLPPPTPTAVAHHSLLTRPLLHHPLQPTPPAKKFRMDDSTFVFKTGASRTPADHPKPYP